jgi:hypothetical protein
VNEPTVSALFFIFLSVCLGFIVGWVCAEQVTRRVNAEAQVEDLFERLEQASIQERQLKEINTVLKEAHQHILAVSKSLENHPR